MVSAVLLPLLSPSLPSIHTSPWNVILKTNRLLPSSMTLIGTAVIQNKTSERSFKGKKKKIKKKRTLKQNIWEEKLVYFPLFNDGMELLDWLNYRSIPLLVKNMYHASNLKVTCKVIHLSWTFFVRSSVPNEHPMAFRAFGFCLGSLSLSYYFCYFSVGKWHSLSPSSDRNSLYSELEALILE